MPHPLPLAIALLDGAGITALILTSYYIYKAYRITESRLFLFFLAGFTLLALSELARAVLMLLTLLLPSPFFLRFFLRHLVGSLGQVLETASWSLIALGYLLEGRGPGNNRAAGPVPVAPPPPRPEHVFSLTYGLNAVILSFIVLRNLSAYAKSGNRSILRTLLAFALILASNVAGLAAVLWDVEGLFILSRVLFVAGLLVFLAFIAGVASSR